MTERPGGFGAYILARVALAKEEISLWGPGKLMTGTSTADGFVSLLSPRAGGWGLGVGQGWQPEPRLPLCLVYFAGDRHG